MTDGTVPEIDAVVNAASYLGSATWKGTLGLDPVPAAAMPGGSAVSPREIIAIFGQSIGPASVVPAQASTSFPATFPLQVTPPVDASALPVKYEVLFKFGSYPTVVSAPIIMVSNNQINAVVPVPPPAAAVYTIAAPNAWIQVQETTGTDATATVVATNWFPVTMVPEVPGVFTFGGLGLGQAAVLNYNATSGYSINSAKNPAPKGSTFSLYVTGMGDLTEGATVTVTDSSTPPVRSSQTFRARDQSVARDHGDVDADGGSDRFYAEQPLGHVAAGGGRSSTVLVERDVRTAPRHDVELRGAIERHTYGGGDLFAPGQRHR